MTLAPPTNCLRTLFSENHEENRLKDSDWSFTYSGSCLPNKLCEFSRNSQTAPFRSHGLLGNASHLGTCQKKKKLRSCK